MASALPLHQTLCATLLLLVAYSDAAERERRRGTALGLQGFVSSMGSGGRAVAEADAVAAFKAEQAALTERALDAVQAGGVFGGWVAYTVRPQCAREAAKGVARMVLTMLMRSLARAASVLRLRRHPFVCCLPAQVLDAVLVLAQHGVVIATSPRPSGAAGAAKRGRSRTKGSGSGSGAKARSASPPLAASGPSGAEPAPAPPLAGLAPVQQLPLLLALLPGAARFACGVEGLEGCAARIVHATRMLPCAPEGGPAFVRVPAMSMLDMLVDPQQPSIGPKLGGEVAQARGRRGCWGGGGRGAGAARWLLQ